ncbi:choline transporter-like protein 2, partial [Biomphalaria glabrata]
EEKKLVAEKFKEGAVDDHDGADADFTDGRILKEYGEPIKYDPSFKGPINNRSCTDIICCIIFIIFLMGMAVVSIVGYARGDPIRLIYPTDSHGNICGYGKYSDRPYLFFFDLVTCAKLGPAVVTGCPTPQVCVKECPSSNFVYVHSVQNVNRSELLCKTDIDPTKAPYKDVPVEKLVKDQLCAAYYLESKPIIGRCMPSIFAKALNKVDALKDNIGNDIKRANGELVTGGLIQNGTIISWFTAAENIKEYLGLLLDTAENIKEYLGLLLHAAENIKEYLGLLQDAAENIKEYLGLLLHAAENIKEYLGLLQDAAENIKEYLGLLQDAAENIKEYLGLLLDTAENIKEYLCLLLLKTLKNILVYC